jgi:hypothetical protein
MRWLTMREVSAMHSDRSTANGLGFLVLFVTALMAIAGPARASTASMRAQQIPIGLLRDVSSVPHFPSSALHIHQGTYCDIEAPVGMQLGLFTWGHSRVGLTWVDNDDVLGGSALGALWAFPLRSFDVGLAARGWGRRVDHSYDDPSEERWNVHETMDTRWAGTLSLGRRLGHRGYMELACSAGQIRHEEREGSGYLTNAQSYEQEPAGEPTWRTALRWSTGDLEDRAWLGHIAYRVSDESTRAEYRLSGDDPVRWNQGVRSRIVEGMLGRRVALKQDVVLTASASASYSETESSNDRSSPDDPPNSAHAYAATFKGQFGLEASPRDWLRLYAGLAGSGSSGNLVHRETEHHSAMHSEFDLVSALSASVGVGLHYRRAYLHVLANNSFSTDDPFAFASVGWSF